MTFDLSPNTIQQYKDFLLNPEDYGCIYKPLHKVFELNNEVVPQNILYNQYVDYIKKPLPKVVFYIIMDEEFAEFQGVCNKTKYFGYKLKLNIED